MPTCPNGHRSAADDWCEVCGHRMADQASAPAAPAGGAAPPPPAPPGPSGYGYPGPPPPAPGPPSPPGPQGGPESSGYGYPGPQGHQQPVKCPQCGTPREAQAPFCEECRYNFLTNTPTTYMPPSSPPQQYGDQQHGSEGLPPLQPLPPQQGPPQQEGPPPQQHPGFPPAPPGPGQQSAGPPPPPPAFPSVPGQGGEQQLDYERSRPSQMNRPAEPLAPGEGFGDPGGQGQAQSGDWTLPPPQHEQQGMPQPPPPPQQQGPPPLAPPQQEQPPQQHGAPPQQQYPQQQPPHQQSGPFQGGPQAPPVRPPEQHEGFPQGGFQQGGSWTAVIAPDRDYFSAMMGRSGPEAANLALPAYSPEQRLTLSGHQMTIGRRRQSTGEAPDIDLGRAPEDPGVSHQHAVLVQQPDGSWSVVDQDSTNGTTVNNGEEPIQPYVPVPLQDGDRIHLGAWTTITLHRS